MEEKESTCKPALIALIGPTAVGKTEISLSLARRLDAEIISVDSRQVYRYLDVGTDKISSSVRQEIPHHLIDTVDPDDIFSVADFVDGANQAAESILARGRVPLLVGGSALFFRALEGNYLTESLPRDAALRVSMEKKIEKYGLKTLHARLAKIDPASAARIHVNDPVRTMRALEIYILSGRTASEWYAKGEKTEPQYRIHYWGLTRPRPLLYQRIEERVRKQFTSGYYEEVCQLLEKGYSPHLPALSGFGYRELVAYHFGELTFEEAIQGDIRATKTYSRRQTTWFKHFSPVTWYDLSEMMPEEVIDQMEREVRDILR